MGPLSAARGLTVGFHTRLDLENDIGNRAHAGKS
jgi:hypothetical protein